MTKIIKKENKNVYAVCNCGKEFVTSLANYRTGLARSCGCTAELNAASDRVFREYKRLATRRNRTFELTSKEFITIAEQPCHYCGIKAHVVKRVAQAVYVYNGIDRMDNSRGYSIDNVVPCCTLCNFAKGTRTYEQFMQWLTIVKKHDIVGT